MLRGISDGARFSAILWAFTVYGCMDNSIDLPDPKMPAAFRFACEPPNAVPPAHLPEASCASEAMEEVMDSACRGDLGFRVSVELDASARPTEAHLEGFRSAAIDACMLEEVRTWRFTPARDCNGGALPSTYREWIVFACSGISTSRGVRSGSLPNNQMQRTAPAQAKVRRR